MVYYTPATWYLLGYLVALAFVLALVVFS